MKQTIIHVSDQVRAIRLLVIHGWRHQYTFTFGWSVAHAWLKDGRWLTVIQSY